METNCCFKLDRCIFDRENLTGLIWGRFRKRHLSIFPR